MRPSNLKRKPKIIFSYEGRNNKTERTYFSHFKSVNDKYNFIHISSGKTDPKGMIESTKRKRELLNYNKDRDLTFIFVDGDNEDRLKDINKLKNKLPNDIKLIVSNPCFELWFLNHFVYSTRPYSNEEVINSLKRYVPVYTKSFDMYDKINNRLEQAIKNSKKQLDELSCRTKTEVVNLFINKVIERQNQKK